MAYPPYEYMNGTLIQSDLSQIFLYINSVTAGMFTPMMVIFFFCVTLITSLIMQQRMTGNMRFETSFLAASFVSTGLSVIMLMNGLLDWWIPGLCAGMFILSVLWVTNSAPSQ